MTHLRSRAHAHPLRDRLLFEYQARPASPSEVARRIGRPLNLVSYHTRVLVEHGFLQLVRTERRRGGTAHLYRSTVAQVIEQDGWIELSAPARRALVRGLVATIADESRRAALESGFDAGYSHISRWPVDLDDEAVTEADRLLRSMIDDLARIQAESDRRGGLSRRPFEIVLMGFHRAADAPR